MRENGLFFTGPRVSLAQWAIRQLLSQGDTMGFTASTTQAFQYSLPYQQVFNAATSALQAVKKATLTGADMNARFITFETPFTFTSYGERFVVGFIPNEQGVIVEVTCTTKGMPNLMQDGRNRKQIARFMDALSGLVQSAPVEVTAS